MYWSWEGKPRLEAQNYRWGLHKVSLPLSLQLHAGWKWKEASKLAVDLDSVLLKVPHSLKAKAESDFRCKYLCKSHKSTPEKAWDASAGFQKSQHPEIWRLQSANKSCQKQKQKKPYMENLRPGGRWKQGSKTEIQSWGRVLPCHPIPHPLLLRPSPLPGLSVTSPLSQSETERGKQDWWRKVLLDPVCFV